jgi:nitrite reductase (NADH) small subunit
MNEASIEVDQDAERVVVCDVGELPPGGRRFVEVDGKRVVCFNVDGRYYALGATCPHRGADLTFGTVCGTMLPSDPHRYIYGRHQQLLRCPWHGWQFELETGRAVFDERTGVPAYPVEVVDDQVRIVIGD